MIPRRRLLGLAALGGAVGTSEAVARADTALEPQLTERSLDGVVRAIEQVRSSLDSQRQFSELQAVRTAQREHLTINGKWPDYIEVGVNVWMGVHDWHIRWQQPLSMGRDGSGRYTLVLMQTVLIMRTDMLGNYVGLPYDNRPQ